MEKLKCTKGHEWEVPTTHPTSITLNNWIELRFTLGGANIDTGPLCPICFNEFLDRLLGEVGRVILMPGKEMA